MRYPCHDVRHQCPPSPARHLPQLVRVPGCRPHRAAHYLPTRPISNSSRPSTARETPAQWRDHILATPDPLQWDCFRFGLIQRSDHFTFYASIDHLHGDSSSSAWHSWSSRRCIAALVNGGRPTGWRRPGSYDDYCVRQRAYTSALTLETPEVRQWIEFAENNGGTLPDFPLPLGDDRRPLIRLDHPAMDEKQTADSNPLASRRGPVSSVACSRVSRLRSTS